MKTVFFLLPYFKFKRYVETDTLFEACLKVISENANKILSRKLLGVLSETLRQNILNKLINCNKLDPELLSMFMVEGITELNLFNRDWMREEYLEFDKLKQLRKISLGEANISKSFHPFKKLTLLVLWKLNARMLEIPP